MRCRFYCCWCCYYTTARANAAQIFAVGVGVALTFLLLLVLLLHYGEGKCCPNIRRWCMRCDAVLLLLMLLLHYGKCECSPNFRRWCRRYHAVFNSANAAITLRRGQMLLKFSPLVYALRCRFCCCWFCYYTTARVNAAQFSPLV